MRMRSIRESTHPFDACPFEAFYHGSWKTVECLQIRAGAKTTLLAGDGHVIKENVPITNLRIRSRKATLSDCSCFLRPGLDVCVLSTCQLTGSSSKEENQEPVWLDAKIRSIERKPHESKCACIVYVSFYVPQGPLGVTKKKLRKDTVTVQTDQIFILQKLERNPYQNEHYRWCISEDCSSLQECKLFPGKFSYDVSWFLVASVQKKIEVDVRSIQTKIVYQLVEDECDKHSPSSEARSKAVNFKLQNGISVPFIVTFTLGKRIGCYLDKDEPSSLYELMGLRRSKRRCIQPELYLGGGDLLDSDADVVWLGSCKTRRKECEGDGRVDSYRREFFSCQGKIKSRELKSMASNLKDHQPSLAPHGKQKSQPSVAAVKDETDQMVCEEDSPDTRVPVNFSTGGYSKAREHQPPLAHQRKHKSQPSSSRVKEETVEIVSEEDSLDTHVSGNLSRGKRKHKPQPSSSRVNEETVEIVSEEDSLDTHVPGNLSRGERKHKSQPSISPVKDETNGMVDNEDSFDTHITGEFSREDGEVGSRYMHMNGTRNVHRTGTIELDFLDAEGAWKGKTSHKKYQRKRDYSSFSVRESFDNAGTYRRRNSRVSICGEMLKRCMENIKSSVNKEHPLAIDKWNEFRATNFLDRRNRDNAPSPDGEEEPEIQVLWKQMELCRASTYLLQDDEGSNVAEVAQDTSIQCAYVCPHEYKLNEEIGIVCQLCGFVNTEIKDVSPTFWRFPSWTPNKWSRDRENAEPNPDDNVGFSDLFRTPAASNTPLSEGDKNVWALIPDLKRKLRLHQMRAFEFLWRHCAGSLVPILMDLTTQNRGGCVISHSPGAGKTMLIIAFLVSYLKLFPGSRPLVLAPKTALYTWSKETIKWEVPVPVYQIHDGETYRGEVLRKKKGISLEHGFPKPDRNALHLVDCMEKIQKWLDHPSILLMSYSYFMTLTREDSKDSHRRYLGQLLRQCPGILILDEGHNPRNNKSRLRKALMKVETRLRILLSGTLFQNNFGEYFNTLTLARPRFVDDVLRKLDRNSGTTNKGGKTRTAIENKARRLFIVKIARKIDSSVGKERMRGLNLLRNLTSSFIDVYDGGNAVNLPGLQCYTLTMKSTPKQQKLLKKLLNQVAKYKGFPLEKEFLATLVSIHPWLLKTTPASSQYFNKQELEGLEKYKFDLKLGSKVRFVMSLVPECIMRKEKVLIFCHNISPIDLFVNLFASSYGWRKGEEVLVLQGKMELFERGIAMDKFEQREGVAKVMLASITACCEGINLIAASRVILLDPEWNPSKTKQAIARAFRPGQEKEVYVYQLLASGCMEEDKYNRTAWKERVSSMILYSEGHVEEHSKQQTEKIEDDLLREIVEIDGANLFHKITQNEKSFKWVGGQSSCISTPS
ncbi:SNF2 domain-containing protein CLASSY 2-like [Rhododendron vialii]|uniref:SNF2 domain-containing protein CLASSY 2-like n=1 Tax=Rhododendron vialii TaxID=182163 RepID=UPI00265F1BCF|nr:SNF2 domain-containing protein CLASSY 2-like [Rhododendron vialii]XP_058184036.1 SNF2 domain-containing protein CLASSY 2-like [Rhododendron vialii]XP_058184037.1 SNF2 domain-containing protein CLASSY 2-like [Rhododendron vialii]